jgi:hypothetical protein
MADDSAENTAPKAAKKPRGRPFQKGVSGNPRGMKPGTKHRVTQIAEALVAGQTKQIMATIIDMAINHRDGAMLRWLGDRIFPVQRDRHVQIDLGDVKNADGALEANRLVLQAVAEGRITPAEGEQISKALAVHIGLYSAVEVESQIEEMERERGIGVHS